MSCKKHVLVSNLPITQTIIVYRFATISNNLMTTESANCLTRKLCKIKSCEKLKLVIEWLCAFAKQPFLKSTISLINIEHEQGASLAVLLWQPCEILKLPKLNVHVTTSYRDSRFLYYCIPKTLEFISTSPIPLVYFAIKCDKAANITKDKYLQAMIIISYFTDEAWESQYWKLTCQARGEKLKWGFSVLVLKYQI